MAHGQTRDNEMEAFITSVAGVTNQEEAHSPASVLREGCHQSHKEIA